MASQKLLILAILLLCSWAGALPGGDERYADWSFTGYGGKTRSIPTRAVESNVKDYGAKGDGESDDTRAIQAAIDAVQRKGGGAVSIPYGRYKITKRLKISKNNVVLKGAGSRYTTIYCPYSLAQIDGSAQKWTSASPYTWSDGLIQIVGQPSSSNDGSTRIGSVVETKYRGERNLRLTTTRGLAIGQWVRLFMSDPGSGSLALAMYGGRLGDCGTTCISKLKGQQDLFKWTSRVERISGNTVTLERPLPIKVSPAWKPQIHKIPTIMVKESGIQGMAVEFSWAAQPRHGLEPGRNAFFVSGCMNCWVKDVRAINVDIGIMVRKSHQVTVTEAVVDYTRYRGASWAAYSGHIGIGLYDSTDVEVSKFDIRRKLVHDVSVRGTILAAFHSGKGYNLGLDGHRQAPYATLYSDIDMGYGTQPFTTGGWIQRGLPVGAYTTYWNVKSSSRGYLDLPVKTGTGYCTWGPNINFIGGYWSGSECNAYYVEQQETAWPKNLYTSQIDNRISTRMLTINDTILDVIESY